MRLSSVRLAWFSWERKRYEPSVALDEQVELLSLIGDIALTDGEPTVHAHAVIGKQHGTAHGGHLLKAYVRPTCEGRYLWCSVCGRSVRDRAVGNHVPPRTLHGTNPRTPGLDVAVPRTSAERECSAARLARRPQRVCSIRASVIPPDSARVSSIPIVRPMSFRVATWTTTGTERESTYIVIQVTNKSSGLTNEFRQNRIERSKNQFSALL